MMRHQARVVLYSLSPICPRCVVVDELMERVCAQLNVLLERKKLLPSIWHCLMTLSRPPVIVIERRCVCRGRIPTEGEIRGWFRDY